MNHPLTYAALEKHCRGLPRVAGVARSVSSARVGPSPVARPTKSLPDPNFFVAVARPTFVGTARRHSSVLQWCSTLIGYLGSRRQPSRPVGARRSIVNPALRSGGPAGGSPFVALCSNLFSYAMRGGCPLPACLS